MFWGVFRKGRMGPGLFFDLEKGESINSMVYQDQILLGPLQQFWEESFGDITVLIVMEDNAPVHKKVYSRSEGLRNGDVRVASKFP